MGESELHRILKEVGLAWLWNQKCRLVATEVWMPRTLRSVHHFSDEQFAKEGLRSIIDVIGIGIKPEANRYYASGDIEYREHPSGKVVPVHISKRKPDVPMIRGIEVKVSKADYRAGYISTGCNYNYILAPMKIIEKKSLPDYVGLIEFNKYKFSLKWSPNQFKFILNGIKVVKRPKWQEVDQSKITQAAMIIGERASRMVLSSLVERLEALPTWEPGIEVYK